MVIAELRDYIQAKRVVNLAQLARHFETSADVVRSWLRVWERKGCIRRLASNCQGCQARCQAHDPTQTEVYVWSGNS